VSQLENNFVRVRERILRHKSLDGYDHEYLSAFMATRHSRTEPMANAIKSFTSSIDNLVKDLERAIKSGVAVARTGVLRASEGTPVSSDDTEYMVRNGLPHLRGVRFESCNTADGHDGSFIPRCAAGVILCYIRQSMYLV
jgi:hypothetical protein